MGKKKGGWFAGRLTELREQTGLSMYALAQKSGVSKQALSRLELGESEPTWDTVQKLALALGIECTEFKDPNITIPAPVPEGEKRQRGRPPKNADLEDAVESDGAKPKVNKPVGEGTEKAEVKKTRKKI